MKFEFPKYDVAATSVSDLKFEDIDGIVVAAGYEPRCRHVLKTLADQWGESPEVIGKKVVLLEFDSQKELDARQSADAFFSAYSPRVRMTVGVDGRVGFAAEMRRALVDGLALNLAGPTRSNVLIDYTSMTRHMYLSTLTALAEECLLLYCYSPGDYSDVKESFPVSAVGRIRSVPGFEGLPFPQRPRLYVLGLGFDATGTMALVDKLEVAGKDLVVFWADPGAQPWSPAQTQKQHQFLIDRSFVRFTRDLRDIRGVAAALERLAFEAAPSHKVVIVPLGPKPHILAAGIAARGFAHTALLTPHMEGGGRREYPAIEAVGEIVVAKVTQRETIARDA